MKIKDEQQRSLEKFVTELTTGEVYRCVQNGNIYLRAEHHTVNLKNGCILYDADCFACAPTLTFLHQPDAYLVV